MLETKITGQKKTDRSTVKTLWNWRAEVLWIVATVVLLLGFVGPLTLFGLALATVAVTAVWWTTRKVAHHGEQRPPWRGPSAA